jgi:tRNA/rRNA methyltransferase
MIGEQDHLLSSNVKDLYVVLVATRNPLNIGAAARAISNFGFTRLRVVNPYEIAFRKAQSAVGASELLARAEEFNSVAEAVADCTLVVGTTAGGDRDLQHPFNRLELGSQLIRERLRSSSVALLFGSEKRGLSNEDLSHCHWLLNIPTRQEHRSMNLGQAVAVCLYELARDPLPAPDGGDTKIASAGDTERIAQLLLEMADKSGYLKCGPTAQSEQRIRRLLHRANLSTDDALLWLGMLRQISWKLRSIV